jgi:uncharacterized protein YjiS (DUF1127 family)
LIPVEGHLGNVIPCTGYPHWRSPVQRALTKFDDISHGLTAIAGQIAAVSCLVRGVAQRARDRALLARFDDRMLRDIGLTPADVMRDINRPFWRD